MKIALAAALVLSLCAPAMAKGPVCALKDDPGLTELQPLQALVLAGRFGDVTKALSDRMGGLDPNLLKPIADAYTKPFASCTTLVVRRDIGGLAQEIDVFEADGQPLFVYWVSGPFKGAQGVVSFNMNSAFDPILQMLH